jgi:hypothetical protein
MTKKQPETLSKFMQGWIANDLASEKTIAVKKIYVAINGGNLTDGVMLSQIMYWLLPDKEGGVRAQVLKDGHYWIAKKYSDWLEECGVSERAARQSISRMVKSKILIKKIWKFDGTPVTHLRPNYNHIETLLMSDGSDRLCQVDVTENVTSITESTTEITTEKEIAPSQNGKSTSSPEATPTKTTPPIDKAKTQRDAGIAAIIHVWDKHYPHPPSEPIYVKYRKVAGDFVDLGVKSADLDAFIAELKRKDNFYANVKSLAHFYSMWRTSHDNGGNAQRDTKFDGSVEDFLKRTRGES